MGRSSAGGTSPTATRVQIGPYYLAWRADRAEWCICWYDPAGRTRRRRGTGLGGGTPDEPTEEARQALARHYLESSKPVAAQEPTQALVAELFTIWLREHVAKKADAARYGISVQHWLRFFTAERDAGRVIAGVTVADINKASVDRFIAFRRREGVGGHTISRDLAALRGALNYAWRNEHITQAPFVRELEPSEKAKPRDLTYTVEEVARILDAAASLPERHHVLLYVLIALSTCGRSEAILDLHDHQIKDGLIFFLDPDRPQTSKRRSIVPIAPTLAPWLFGIKGKVIVYRAEIAERHRKDGEPIYFERPSYDIGRAFEACLIDAGVTRTAIVDGKPVIRGRGTPNTLRHTIISAMHRANVDERQIDQAAGHAPVGTGKKNYMHLRPDYLADLIEAIEGFWQQVGQHTKAHLRTQCGPETDNSAQSPEGEGEENGRRTTA